MSTTRLASGTVFFAQGKRRFLLTSFAMVFIMFLSACTVVPGSKVSAGNMSDEEKNKQKDAEPLPDIIQLKPISTALMTPEQSDAVEEKADIDAELISEMDGSPYQYLVGPGDVLNVTVWDHPELTIPAGSLRSAQESGNWVHADGSIFYPYVGRIEVAGLDVAEIRDLITKRIGKYIENPQVDVTVAAFRAQRIYVTGEVASPGAVPITNVPLRLIDAVNVVGGITKFASWQNVTLTRDGKEYTLSLESLYQKGDVRQNILLRDKDVLHIASNLDNKVFVLGEVREARAVYMERNGLSLAGALAEAGGLNELTSNASGVFVMRRGVKDDKPSIDVYQLNAKNAAAFVLADQFEMQPRDIVYVTAAPVTRWNRVIQQILPTAQTIYFGVVAEDRLQGTN
ncbi:MAG: polysaccharide export protein [Alcanivoracaceae bacterium]|nr:polysaccharide export protein [Alcanivoracaceae bacterium]